MRRKKEKEDFIATRLRSLDSTPPSLDLSSSGLQDSIDQVVRVTGKLDFEGQIFHGPRTCPVRQQSAQRPGFFVHTPLILEDGKRVLVNCGWVPGTLADADVPVVRAPYFPSDSVEIIGVVKKTAFKAPWFFPKESAPKHWVFMQMERASNLLHVDHGGVIDAIEIHPMVRQGDGDGFDGPILKGRETVTDVPITPTVHLIYAVTWYSLAIIGTAVGVSRFGKPMVGHLRNMNLSTRRKSSGPTV